MSYAYNFLVKNTENSILKIIKWIDNKTYFDRID